MKMKILIFTLLIINFFTVFLTYFELNKLVTLKHLDVANIKKENKQFKESKGISRELLSHLEQKYPFNQVSLKHDDELLKYLFQLGQQSVVQHLQFKQKQFEAKNNK